MIDRRKERLGGFMTAGVLIVPDRSQPDVIDGVIAKARIANDAGVQALWLGLTTPRADCVPQRPRPYSGGLRGPCD